jgi:hypothetical protein
MPTRKASSRNELKVVPDLLGPLVLTTPRGDNIHFLNTSGAAAHITVGLPGATPVTVTLASLAETYVTSAPGQIGGPVTVTSDQPVLSSQRVQYYQSFNETPSEPAG